MGPLIPLSLRPPHSRGECRLCAGTARLRSLLSNCTTASPGGTTTLCSIALDLGPVVGGSVGVFAGGAITSANRAALPGVVPLIHAVGPGGAAQGRNERMI